MRIDHHKIYQQTGVNVPDKFIKWAKNLERDSVENRPISPEDAEIFMQTADNFDLYTRGPEAHESGRLAGQKHIHVAPATRSHILVGEKDTPSRTYPFDFNAPKIGRETKRK